MQEINRNIHFHGHIGKQFYSGPGHVLECSQVTVTGLWGRMGHKRAENPQEEPALQRVLELVALQVLRQ